MKNKLELQELAQLTYQGLKRKGILVTLSGGACVSIYSRNAYQSRDLDFIRELTTSIVEVAAAMAELGFRREGRLFVHPDSEYYVEFPPPPLTVGNEKPRSIVEKVLRTKRGRIPVRMLSRNDCIKDRLCQYFYWKDRQSLDQAVLVAMSGTMDRAEIEKWAGREGMQDKCTEFFGILAEKSKQAPERRGSGRNRQLKG